MSRLADVDAATRFARHFGDLVRLLHEGADDRPGREQALAGAVAALAEDGVRLTAAVDQLGDAPSSYLRSRMIERYVDAIAIGPGTGPDELGALALALADDERAFPSFQGITVTLAPIIHEPAPAPLAAVAAGAEAASTREVSDRRAGAERRRRLQLPPDGVERRRGRERRQLGERRRKLRLAQQARRAALLARLEDAVKHQEWADALATLTVAIALLPNVPAEDRGAFRLAVRRHVRRAMLEQFVALALADPGRRDEALVALRWAGVEGAEAMLAAVMGAETLGPRAALAEALLLMPEAFPLLRPYLEGRVAWQACRAARLAGRFGHPEATPLLEGLQHHPDAHVRETAVRALADLPDGEAVPALRRALHSPDPTSRRAAAAAIAARPRAALALALVTVLDEERDDDVWFALVDALGGMRAGEAVRALLALAQRRWRLFGGGLPRVKRLRAVAALAGSAAPGARAALETLARSRDGAIRDAARRALAARDASPGGA